VHWKQLGYGLDTAGEPGTLEIKDDDINNNNNNDTNINKNSKNNKFENSNEQKVEERPIANENIRLKNQIRLILDNFAYNNKINRSTPDASGLTPIQEVWRSEIRKSSVINKSLFRNNVRDNSSGTIWPTYVNGTFAGDDRIVAQLRYRPPSSSSSRQRYRTIYMPTGLGDLPAGRTKFQNDRCPVRTCSLTSDSRQEWTADLRILEGNAFYDEPPQKPRGQIWLLWLLESPVNTITFRYLKGLVNWTATYRSDSTLVTPYEKFVPYSDDFGLDDFATPTSAMIVNNSHITGSDYVVKSNDDKLFGNMPISVDHRSHITGSRYVDHRNDEKLLNNIATSGADRKYNYAAGKTRMVAWFVSNCGANNRRWEFMQELRRHVPVDVYGDCTNGFKCARTEQKTCDELLSREYKFYLSFENSNCQYYITEKFFRNALW